MRAMTAPLGWGLLTLAAALAIVSLSLLSFAYARAEAQALVPLEYSMFVWAALLGYLVFDETIGWTTLAGASADHCRLLAGDAQTAGLIGRAGA